MAIGPKSLFLYPDKKIDLSPTPSTILCKEDVRGRRERGGGGTSISQDVEEEEEDEGVSL